MKFHIDPALSKFRNRINTAKSKKESGFVAVKIFFRDGGIVNIKHSSEIEEKKNIT